MPVAVVFGAGVHAGGQPDPMLADRMDTAIALYEAGKVRKLLVAATTACHSTSRADV